MPKKGFWLFWTNVLNALLSLGMVGTGVVMKWVLPPGSGGGREGMGMGHRGGRGAAPTLWDWTRHDWGDVHFWLAVALVAGVLLHLALHWGWIKASTFRYLIPLRRRPRAISIT